MAIGDNDITCLVEPDVSLVLIELEFRHSETLVLKIVWQRFSPLGTRQ